MSTCVQVRVRVGTYRYTLRDVRVRRADVDHVLDADDRRMKLHGDAAADQRRAAQLQHGSAASQTSPPPPHARTSGPANDIVEDNKYRLSQMDPRDALFHARRVVHRDWRSVW